MAETMKAGRELDALIAEKVMGKRVIYDRNGESVEFYGEYPSNGFFATPRPYSTEIGQAWKVVEKMRADSIYIDIQAKSEGYTTLWGRAGTDDEDIWVCNGPFHADAAPLALCLAALDAVNRRAPFVALRPSSGESDG